MNRFILFLTLAFIPVGCIAQSIKGTATDDSGEPVIGAIIELFHNGEKYAGTVTDIDGNYIFTEIHAGEYNIVAKAEGYRSVTILHCPIASNCSTFDIDFEMAEFFVYCTYYCMRANDVGSHEDLFSWEYKNEFFDENKEPWFSPNPTTNILNVTYKDVSGQFFITDMTGRSINTFKADPSGKSSIDISELPAGNYIISYQYDGNKRISGKFTVLR